MKIGIFGSAGGNVPSDIEQKARSVGQTIAHRGHILVTGGCPGLPHMAVLAAHEAGGTCVAYSPGVSLEDHKKRFEFPTDGFNEFVFIPRSFEYQDQKSLCLKFRNIRSTSSVDAGIIIAGRTGTMNEFTLLYDFGKNIGVLQNSGGITSRAIPFLLQDIDKDRGSKIVYESDPRELVLKLERIS